MRKQILLLFIVTAGQIFASGTTPQAADSLACELQEIVVTANQPTTKLVGHTLISTIGGTPLQNLGSALDVLAQLPMINVSDNEVSVSGKGTPEIFIDGRPVNDGTELARLLSDNIRRVELVMAPGAEYASTTKAVIKIITRRNFLQGLSVTDKAEIRMRRRFSANDMLDLNYHSGNWDFFASGTLTSDKSLTKGSTVNSLIYDGSPTVIGSSQHNVSREHSGAVKGGINHTSDTRSVGAYYLFIPQQSRLDNSGHEWLDGNDPVERLISRKARGHSHLISAYYDETFGDKFHLHFDGDYKSADTDNRVTTSYPSAQMEDVSSSQHRRSSLLAGKLYLNAPLFGGKLTAGTQDSHSESKLDFLMLNEAVSGYLPSSTTDVRQTSLAFFGSWSRMFGKFSLTAGLRYEYSDYDFRLDGKRDSRLSRKDRLLTPDLSFGYSFGKNAQVSLSYRMASVRPPYSYLSGGLNYVGIHEIEGGNTALRDERNHDIRLFTAIGDFMLQADFTRSLDSYAFVKELYPAPSLQLLMHPVNIDVSAIDIYLIWSRKISRWSPQMVLGAYRQWLSLGGREYHRPIFSYDFSNTLSLPKGFLLTLNLRGQSKGDMHTNRFGRTVCCMDMSVEKSFFGKALSLKMAATDILNTLNNDWSMTTCGINVDKRQSYDRRGLSLSLTYRFQPRQSAYKGKAASEAEMKRL